MTGESRKWTLGEPRNKSDGLLDLPLIQGLLLGVAIGLVAILLTL